MEQITVNELLANQGLSWYGLFKRGAGSKSMCRDWVTGKHLPSTRSAARIARALGLPIPYVLGILRTRDPWENSPRATWGTYVRKALEAARTTNTEIITDRIESGVPVCLTCGQMIRKAA